MAEFDKLTVRIEADLSEYKRNLAEIERSSAKTAERIGRTFENVNRTAGQTARGPQAFGVQNRRASTLRGDARNLANGPLVAREPGSISQAVSKLADSPAGDVDRRLAKMSKQVVSTASILTSTFGTLFKIVGVIGDIVSFVAIGSKLMSNETGGLNAAVEAQNQLVREQVRRLRKIKGLIDPLAEETEKTENLLSREKSRLKSLRSRKESVNREIGEIESGRGDTSLDQKTNLDNALRNLGRIGSQISQTNDNIILLQEALAAQIAARDSQGPSISAELERCLQLLCDRLESFGQDIPFDRASARPGGGRVSRPPFRTDDADTTERSLLRLDTRLGDAAQSFVALTEEAGRFTVQGRSLGALLEATNGGFDRQAGVIGTLLKQVPELGESMTGFLGRTTEGAEGLGRTVEALGTRFLDAFEGAILRGESLSDTLKSLGRDLANLALQEVKSGLLGGGSSGGGGLFGSLFGGGGGPFGGLGALFGSLGGLSPSGSSVPGPHIAKGGVFSGGSLTALAKGGALLNSVVDRPTLFPMADGAGLLGEAGPEAVLPLTRLASGELGVKALPGGSAVAAGAPVNVVVHNAIDARGADRSGLIALERRLGAMETFLRRDLRGAILGTVLDSRRRGGAIARAFGAR